MMEKDFLPATDLMDAIGEDVIEIQRQWNRANEKEIKRFKCLLNPLKQSLGEIALQLHPRRQVLDTMSIGYRARVAIDQKINTRIMLKPLNIGYDLLFGSTASSETRIQIEVDQVPWPADYPNHG
ncbi:MAG: hypothetical protein GY860_17930 [Desulfobacteraceae bacterium]|nr:hypothetical protein [Desulfobacteraceae bacterium]